MTKELLEQYPDICEEIRELEEDSRSIVTDTVSASMEEYPYSQHTVTIRGVRPQNNAERLEDFRRQKAEIEAFVAGLPLPKQRLCRAVMRHGARWNLVRRSLRSYKSPDALRVEFSRFFKNIF